MLSNTKGNSFADPELALDLGDEFLDEEVLGDESIEAVEDTDLEEGLGELGAHKGRRRRRRKSRARRLRRMGGKKHRRRRRKHAAKVTRKGGRRRRRRSRKALKVQITEAPKRKRRRRKHARRARRMAGVHGLYGMEDFDGEEIGTLGAGRKRRRKHRKMSKASAKRKGKRRRKGARRAHRYSAGLGSLANMSGNLGDAEVKASMPVFGVLEYLGTGTGLEALGGVTLSAFVTGAVNLGVMQKLFKLDAAAAAKPMATLGTALISGVIMWELGRILNSGNIAKYGAFYAFGKAIDQLLIKPQVVDKLFPAMSGYGLGQARIPDQDTLVGWGLGQERIPDTSTSFGQVLFPNIKRENYAINPLSGMGQERIPDNANAFSGLGQERIPDNANAFAGMEKVVTEEELLGEFGQEEGGSAEGDSAVF
jgi:hypothetical protein